MEILLIGFPDNMYLLHDKYILFTKIVFIVQCVFLLTHLLQLLKNNLIISA